MSLFSVSPECDKADPSAHLPGHFPYSSNMEDVLPSRLRCRPLVNSSRGEGLLGYSFSAQMENIESLFVTMGEAYSWGKVIKTACGLPSLWSWQRKHGESFSPSISPYEQVRSFLSLAVSPFTFAGETVE